MPRITALEPQRHDPDRLNVHLDGDFAFGVSAAVAAEAGLHIGRVLAREEIEALHERDRARRALDRALNFIAYRPRSEREVRQNLERAGFEPEHIETALARLRDWNYLSDAEFARYWIENRSRHSPRGERALSLELRQKGVDRAVIDTAIEASALDPVEAAVRAGRRKARHLAGLDPATFRQRLGAFLARRGFDWETIRAAVAALHEETTAEPSADPGDEAEPADDGV